MRTGNRQTSANAVALATSMQRGPNPVTFGTGQNQVYCSKFAATVYGESGATGISGIGPNSQYFQWRMQGK